MNPLVFMSHIPSKYRVLLPSPHFENKQTLVFNDTIACSGLMDNIHIHDQHELFVIWAGKAREGGADAEMSRQTPAPWTMRGPACALHFPMVPSPFSQGDILETASSNPEHPKPVLLCGRLAQCGVVWSALPFRCAGLPLLRPQPADSASIIRLPPRAQRTANPGVGGAAPAGHPLASLRSPPPSSLRLHGRRCPVPLQTPALPKASARQVRGCPRRPGQCAH